MATRCHSLSGHHLLHLPTPTWTPPLPSSVGHPTGSLESWPWAGGSVFILKSSFSCPGPSTWLFPGPIVLGPWAIWSILGENKGAPQPHFLTTTGPGLQVPDLALNRINTTLNKRHPSMGLSSEGQPQGTDPRVFCLRCHRGQPQVQGCPCPNTPCVSRTWSPLEWVF